MDATPIDLRNARLSEGAFAPSAAVAPSGCGSGAGAHADVIGMKWAALHDAAAVAARLGLAAGGSLTTVLAETMADAARLAGELAAG